MGISPLAELAAEIREIRQARKEKPEELLSTIPENWTDFARLTKIRSGGDVKPFNPYPYQEELVKLMLERSVAVVKSRQLGISETITCFMLWRACLNPGYLGLVFSKTQTDSSLLARRMKRMIASLGLKTATENLSDIEIQGYGRILFRNSRPDSARGIESVVDVFYDEFAFLETAKEVFDAVAPAQQMVGEKARTFIVSTPNGQSGYYWDLLNSGNGNRDIESICETVSKNQSEPFQHWVDEGGWGKVLIHWRSHPEYGSNPNFLQEIHEKKKLSWQTIQQEYDLSFQQSDTNYFDALLVRSCESGASKLEEVDEKANYYIGIDTSTTGNDFFVAIVIKEISGKYSLVDTYRKRQQTSEYHLYQVANLIEKYKPESVGIEITGGVGQVFLEQLCKQFKSSNIKAIRTTGDSKPAMLSTLLLAMESKVLSYPSDSPIVDELLSFRRKDKKLEAASGKHDDVVMALCFALEVSSFSTDNGFSFNSLPLIN